MSRLLKETEFQDGTWQLVDSPTYADLIIELDRVPWTWDFTYTITHPPSGLVFGSGKVIAWDGVRAASGIAKRIIKDLRALRAAAPADSPAQTHSLDESGVDPGTDANFPENGPMSQTTSPLPRATPGNVVQNPSAAGPPATHTSAAVIPPAPVPVSPPGSSPTAAGEPAGTFLLRVDVELVMVEAAVRGPGNSEPTGQLAALTQGDFEVLEDGRKQSIQHFSRDQLPLAVALVVDTSGSVAPFVHELRQAALEALAQLKPGDQVCLYLFSETAQRAVDLTADTRQVARSISVIQAGGGTNILDALRDAISYLRREAMAHRRVLILVSDNVPTVESRIAPKAVTRMASETETVIYSIQTPGPRVGQHFTHLGNVEQIAKEAGGEVIGADRPGAVSSALATVVKRLKTRYTLGYYPSNKAHDGTFRVIEVRLTDRFGQLYTDYSIFSRRGYYAPKDQSMAAGRTSL